MSPGRTFVRCVPCAKRLPTTTHDGLDRHGQHKTYSTVNAKAFHVERTGRTRDQQPKTSTRTRYAGTEWRCKECGHTWWSTKK